MRLETPGVSLPLLAAQLDRPWAPSAGSGGGGEESSGKSAWTRRSALRLIYASSDATAPLSSATPCNAGLESGNGRWKWKHARARPHRRGPRSAAERGGLGPSFLAVPPPERASARTAGSLIFSTGLYCNADCVSRGHSPRAAYRSKNQSQHSPGTAMAAVLRV